MTDNPGINRRKDKLNDNDITTDIITTHVNADFDALASMIAAKKLYPDATLVFPGSQEKNLRNFFMHSTLYLFNFAKIKHINFEQIKRLILVDTRQKSRIGKFAEIVDNKELDIHIYDHHPDSNEDIHGSLEAIEKTGSTTAILTNIIKKKGIKITTEEATIMCLGIHEDTGSFTFPSTTYKDHNAAAWLVSNGANHNIISDMLTRELTAEQVWILNDLTKSATTHIINGTEVVIANVQRDYYAGDFAVLVHKFMDMENLNVLFALAQMEDKIYLVARSRIDDVNAAEIALIFGGGGHPQAASATIKNKTIMQMEKSLLAILKNRINPQKKAGDMMSSPAIHISPDGTVKEASSLMTRYNINVLIVLDENGLLQGYLTRQIMDKAVFFSLGSIKVREYMNIEFSTVSPDTSLKEVQSLIIKNRLRILPVVDNSSVVGVITRTDLLNILVGEPVISNFLYESQHASEFTKKRNIASLLKERLPRRILELLKDFGETADSLGYNAYLMGGLVRDVFLKQENLDVDIVIEGDGITFARKYSSHNSVRVRTHKKFGTAILVFPDGFKVDVATARMEFYETPAAPPIVETSSLRMDLFRRDFTINTLAIKLNNRDYGTLIDYFGGQKDLKEKVIRVLHNLSFVEDPTRILRAIRFEQRFGFIIDKLTQTLIKNAVTINCFEGLSGRRLFLELKLLLMENQPRKAIERMSEFDLLQFISPEIEYDSQLGETLENISGVTSWFDLLFLDEPYDTWKIYWFGIVSSLEPLALNSLAKKMQMEDLESRRMISQMKDTGSILEELFRVSQNNNVGIYKLLSQYDTEILLFLMAKANNEKIKKIISTYFTKLKSTVTKITGRDLKEMGFKPGPLYKEILTDLLEEKLNNRLITKADEIGFINDRFGKQL